MTPGRTTAAARVVPRRPDAPHPSTPRTDTDARTSTSTGSGTDARTDARTSIGTDARSDADARTVARSGTDAHTGARTGTDARTGSGTDARTGSGARTGTSTSAGAGTGATGLGSVLVPVVLGGVLDRADILVESLRPVFRHDVTAGMALAAAPLTAALHVWCAGSPQQQRHVADLLLQGGSLALSRGPHTVGQVFATDGLHTRQTRDGYLLDGTRTPLTAGPEAAALLLYTTVAPSRGVTAPGGATVLLAGLGAVPHGRAGLRLPDGVRFTRCLLPPAAAVAEPGRGTALFLRTLQVTGTVVPALLLGTADSCLRLALRRLTGAPGPAVGRMGSRDVARAVAGAFLDLTAADALATTAARALGVLPGESAVLSAAVSCVVPMLIEDALQDLGPLLGARALWRDGDEPHFAHQAHHLRALAPRWPGAFTGRAIALPHLPFLARHAWFNTSPAPARLFATGGDLPGLAWQRLVPFSRTDSLSAVLPAAGGRARAAGHDELARLITAFTAELDRVRRHFARLPLTDPSLTSDPRNLAMTDRYMLLLTAAACLGRHQEASRTGQGHVADTVWITATLRRLGRRLGLGAASASPAAENRHIHDEALRHCAADEDFGVHRAAPVA
ncbi:hypothetical protein [Streptomyces sp. NPDC001930]|uniref:hypothetical protein n=1 Tax=Streptomyces sp. NPDC001930 TaxID=3364625 RepID=UPI0036BF72B2